MINFFLPNNIIVSRKLQLQSSVFKTIAVLQAVLIAAALIIFTCTVAGCNRNINQAAINQNSRTIRIISAAPSITEIIAGLGYAGSLIAVDKYSQNVEGVRKGLPEIDFFNPDMEAIVSLKPDIIISGEINTNGNANTPFDFFTRLGITVIQIQTSNSINDIYNDIETIAAALDAEEKGKEMILNMRNQIEAVAAASLKADRAAVSGKESRQNVYFEIAPAPNMVSFGQGTYLNELIKIAGAKNIFAGEKRWFIPAAEAIISANPDLIFILDGVSNIEEIKNRPGFKAITAIKQNRIFLIDADRASRPSQNIVQTLEEIHKAVWQDWP